MDEKTQERNSKAATVTAENRIESAKLMAIWLSKKALLKSRGLGTQEALGATFGVSQGSVGHFLHGRSAISLKAAIGFAKALDCHVSDFSPRLATMLGGHADLPGQDAPVAAESEPYENAGGSGPLMIRAQDALEHLSITIQAVPERQRDSIARELALLASVPDSPTLVRRIAAALAPYDAPRVPRTLAQMSADVDKREKSMGALLGRRLEEVRDAKRRRSLFALLEGLIDRVLYDGSDDAISSIAESTRDLRPSRSPSPLP